MVQGRLPDSIDCDVDLWNHASLLLGEEDFEAREEELQLQLLQALVCDDLVDPMAGVSMDAKEDESDALAIQTFWPTWAPNTCSLHLTLHFKFSLYNAINGC